MQADLAAKDDDMWYVITNRPMKIMKDNTAVALTDGAPHRIEKPCDERTTEDKRKSILNNIAKHILYKTLEKNTFNKIKMSKSVKKIWEKLVQCEGNKPNKENKLSIVVQKFVNIKMKVVKSMNKFYERVSSIVNELNVLEKVYSNKEVSLNVMSGFPKEWDVKTMAILESKHLNKVELHDLFADLKVYGML
ncbi:uncharacterized protein LOC142532252 [Primulina tabacum]|uniref:uncharacterized protein LOC142532252 n=1 Tax=Primulina tabacum TaxID=48773 RepID=UPI003F59223E